jgi:hypothetical protein
MSEEVFELELLGGEVEGRYRAARPEVEEMPWGTLDLSAFSPALLGAARRAWTGAAFQEYRTGAACAAALEALFEARAPLDLIALATRFPLDEAVHVELCSRLAMELGGAVELRYQPAELVGERWADLSPLRRATHMVVSYFCVGEALSIPLIHGTYKAARHPLPKAILRRIALDEADHGTFGWTYLDWALPLLAPEDLRALAATAAEAIRGVERGWEEIAKRPAAPEEQIYALGWMGTAEYLALARRALERQVIAPLLARGIEVGTGVAV